MITGYIARAFSSHPDPKVGIGPTKPRILGLVTALLSVVGLALIGAGAQAAAEISEISMIAGFAPPAGTGVLLTFIAGILGLATMYTSIVAHKESPLRKRTLIGLPLIGACAFLLSVILTSWGITAW